MTYPAVLDTSEVAIWTTALPPKQALMRRLLWVASADRAEYKLAIKRCLSSFLMTWTVFFLIF